MAKADLSDNTSDLPAEGVSLADAFNLVFWRHKPEILDAARQVLFNGSAREWGELPRAVREACAAYLRERLESGAWVLACYRADQPAKPMTIAAPMTRHFQFDRDAVHAPDGSIYYAPRVYAAATAPKLEPLPVSVVGPVAVELPVPPTPHPPAAPLPTKDWLTAEVARRRDIGDIPGTITEFSRQLEYQMAQAARANRVRHAVGARRIETLLRELKLF